MRANALAASEFLKSLASEHRLMILCQLVEGEKSVGELQALLDMRQAHLSQQLARLRADGVVRTRREAQTIYYELDSEAAIGVLELLYKVFCQGSNVAARTAAVPAEAG